MIHAKKMKEETDSNEFPTWTKIQRFESKHPKIPGQFRLRNEFEYEIKIGSMDLSSTQFDLCLKYECSVLQSIDGEEKIAMNIKEINLNRFECPTKITDVDVIQLLLRHFIKFTTEKTKAEFIIKKITTKPAPVFFIDAGFKQGLPEGWILTILLNDPTAYSMFGNVEDLKKLTDQYLYKKIKR